MDTYLDASPGPLFVPLWLTFNTLGRLAHLYVLCKGGDPCCRRREFYPGLAPLIVSRPRPSSLKALLIAAPRLLP